MYIFKPLCASTLDQWAAISDHVSSPREIPVNKQLKVQLERAGVKPPDTIPTDAEPHLFMDNEAWNYCTYRVANDYEFRGCYCALVVEQMVGAVVEGVHYRKSIKQWNLYYDDVESALDAIDLWADAAWKHHLKAGDGESPFILKV
ncbi:protein ORF73 [Anguillid herpesvirus 1]|uniref:Protein ORF73 n=1 Tax=Anguillid herpesvirus 1 TaxID=150286 RepID=A0A1J0RED8_9VIRU|nr:protein ORF73 [Anguillid herpesvirus 1]ADA57836.1 protein ORF73 [Anguillid herpesvirus 1]APD76235.1 ORF73 [Anguillid herpesvirus 1]QRM16366.1 protein ORF73 [Anguillid herpesvirus 1]QRM16625.1 protein ORF73 [Anguillid herpesvirus 1]QRM16758.1 protein ORF73 [Anguillid herpesvirus 1]